MKVSGGIPWGIEAGAAAKKLEERCLKQSLSRSDRLADGSAQ